MHSDSLDVTNTIEREEIARRGYPPTRVDVS